MAILHPFEGKFTITSVDVRLVTGVMMSLDIMKEVPCYFIISRLTVVRWAIILREISNLPLWESGKRCCGRSGRYPAEDRI